MLMSSNETWISVGQAAKLSGYHPERIRELIREGKIDAKKFSIVWQVNHESLVKYLADAQKSTDKRHGPKANK